MKIITCLLLLVTCISHADERSYADLPNDPNSGIFRAYGTDRPIVFMEQLHPDFTTTIIRKDLRDNSELSVVDGRFGSAPLYAITNSGIAVNGDFNSSIEYTPPSSIRSVLIYDGPEDGNSSNLVGINRKGLIVWNQLTTNSQTNISESTFFQYKMPNDEIERTEDKENVSVRYQQELVTGTNYLLAIGLLDNGNLVVNTSPFGDYSNGIVNGIGILDKKNNFKLITEYEGSADVHTFGNNFIIVDPEGERLPLMYKDKTLFSLPSISDKTSKFNNVIRNQTSRSGYVVFDLIDSESGALEYVFLWDGVDIVAINDAERGSLNERGDFIYFTLDNSLFIRNLDGSIEELTPTIPEGFQIYTPYLANDGKVLIPFANDNVETLEEYLESFKVLIGQY